MDIARWKSLSYGWFVQNYKGQTCLEKISTMQILTVTCSENFWPKFGILCQNEWTDKGIMADLKM